MAKKKTIDSKRVAALYKKYGSMNRAALSLDCAPSTVKKILVENGIEIKKYIPKRWDIKLSKF